MGKKNSSNKTNAGESLPPRTEEKGSGLIRRGISGETKLRWRRLAILGAAGVALAIAGISTFSGFDWAKLQQSIAGLNSFLVFALMATLPVAGFSVGVIYLVAGAKFGPLLGGVLVAAATVVHLLLTHWIAGSFLRGPLLRLLARRNHRLPEIPPGENAAVSVMAALVPGLPYFARNYLLALSGVPFRTYFWICLPIYVARSYVTIFLGDLSGDPSRRGFLVLVAVYVVKLGICALLLARMRHRYKLRQPQPAAALAPAPDDKPGPARKQSRPLARSA